MSARSLGIASLFYSRLVEILFLGLPFTSLYIFAEIVMNVSDDLRT